MKRIAISGFGRIGRNFLRTIMQDPQALQQLKVITINIGPARLDLVAHLFKYDSLMGTYKGTVELRGNDLVIDDYAIELIAQVDPSSIDWHKRNIDWVVECSGRYTKRDQAIKHINAGARAVLISAPAQGDDVTIVPGVNDAMFDKEKHKIVSLGSCTTNAFATMLKVMHDAFVVDRCCMTTVHAYTNTQVLLDVESSDPRRARAAATGASDVVGKVLPDLADRIQAVSLRVPVAKVSLIDAAIITAKPLTVASINDAFSHVAQGSMKGILGVTREPLVSSDFSGDSHSAVVDQLLTQTCGSHFGKIFGWYDNEWGYSERLKDFLMLP
jgi:glyceraldehyde-3-phosphate dehydrogenase type I